MSDVFVANYPEIDEFDFFEYTVDTSLSSDGPVANLPIYNYFKRPGIQGTILVDWGDGIKQTIEVSSSTTPNDTLHTYAQAGIYNIRMTIKNFTEANYLNCGGSRLVVGLRCIISINSAVPRKMFNQNYAKSLFINFYNCKNLSYVPPFIFDNITTPDCDSISDNGLRGGAGSCANYAAESAMFGNTAVGNEVANGIMRSFPSTIEHINGLFENCKNITDIPSDALQHLTNLNHAVSLFEGTSITNIPSNLLKNNIKLEKIDRLFSYTNITNIPSDLFSGLSSLKYIGGLFSKCSKLLSVPDSLFFNNKNISCIDSLFSDCSNLTNLPSILFDKSTSKITTLNYVFSGCKLLTDEDFHNFFDNNFICSNITSVSGLFYDTNIETTHQDIIALFINAKKFGTVYNSTKISVIEPTLFANNTQVTDFTDCFNNCTKITSIPSELFANNTQVIYFSGCFSGCNALADIPPDLFANNTHVSHFNRCFFSCDSLTSIPSELFANNTQATDFSSCFSTCTGLISVPPELFANNTQATNFNRCFSGCSNITSAVPELWNTHPNASHSACFRGCKNAANYADIPDDWK